MGTLKIGINALFRGKPTGAANYIINLINHIIALDREIDYYILMKREHADHFNLDQENLHHVFCNVKTENPIIRRVWEQTKFPEIVHRKKLDILHCPMNVVPLFVRCKCIVTFLDCQYFHDSSKNTFFRRNFHRIFMRLSLKKSDAIITISKSMKDEIFRRFGQNCSDIYVTHLGQNCGSRVEPSVNSEEIKRKLKLSRKYLLFVGFPSYRKNVPGLLEGFAGALQRLPNSYDLVICGDIKEKIESDYFNIHKAIAKLKIKNHVKFVDYLEKSDLQALMVGAELLTFPSFYEGFGLPVIEAMACGTPVLVSDIPVMHEIVGDVGLFVNPYDTDDISKGIYRLLMDDDLRRGLALRGKDRAARFTWKNTATKTLECYLHVAKGKVSSLGS